MATKPVEKTWVDLEPVRGADFNSNIRDASLLLLSPPLAIVRATVTQSVSNNTFTAVNFDAEDVDRDGGHSTISNTSRFTCVTEGYYLCTGVIAWAANATGRRICYWAVSGSPVNGSRLDFYPVQTGNPTIIPMASRLIHLDVGDYLQMMGYHDINGGGALSTAASGSAMSFMTVRWVSD